MSENELSKAYEPTQVEAHWYPVWMEKGYFHAEPESRRPPFCIVLPPPNVTGSLHLGHALTATLQDTLIRWKRMSGYNCLWLPGTDHAGIATQMVVERELKKTEGKSRHDLGRGPFLERVWKWKEKYGARIGEQHRVLGASLDWARERFTMDPGVSAAVREVFVRLHEEKLIYRAEKLINWCPSCRTALSDLEVDHEEKDGSLWHLRYPVKGTDRFLTVATTRPETMLGDTAVAIHPDDERYQGLAGKTVVLPLVGREIPIITDAELVNPEFGTGVVKVTPAHDHNDYQTGLRHKLPMVTILDEAARMNEAAGRFAGLDRFEARKQVLEALQGEGLLEKEEPHKLSVGQCQRCATVVEPRLSPQWFVKIEPLAKPAIEAVEQGRTRFVPENWTQTYFHWMRNIHDWCISRQLWWGHQIPAYYCKEHSPRLSTGGIDYAKAEPIVAREAPASCGTCGGTAFEQDPDVLDTWFSSALWPFSTLGWPEKTPELRAFYPNAVMETGHDIIFFWVSRMMMMGLHFMKDVPFRTVYLHAMIRDEKGEKMSKVKGNVIDPLDVIRGAEAKDLTPALRNKFPQGMPAFGADALRFTLASLTQQGRDIKLSLDRVAGYKAFTNKLWNASRFALMNLGDFRPDGTFVRDLPLTLADRWILARLNRAVAETATSLDEYDFAGAASTLYQFLWYELCDWYIELAKPSLYGEDAERKRTTRAVLVYVLDQVLRLLHPLMPFITEEIWQKLPLTHPTESIMLAAYPTYDQRLEDPEAEAEMRPLIEAIEGIRNIRGESNLSPAAKLTAHVFTPDAATQASLRKWSSYLKPLAGLAEVHVSGGGHKPAQSAAFVGERLEIYVPLAGLIDVAEEQGRLQKELAKVEQDLGSLARKLDNPNFVAKAPPDVVEKDRARVQELLARKKKLQDNLRSLGDASDDDKTPALPSAPVASPLRATDGPLSSEQPVVAVAQNGFHSGNGVGHAAPRRPAGAEVIQHAVAKAKEAAQRVRAKAQAMADEVMAKAKASGKKAKAVVKKAKPAKKASKPASKPAGKAAVKKAIAKVAGKAKKATARVKAAAKASAAGARKKAPAKVPAKAGARSGAVARKSGSRSGGKK